MEPRKDRTQDLYEEIVTLSERANTTWAEIREMTRRQRTALVKAILNLDAAKARQIERHRKNRG